MNNNIDDILVVSLDVHCELKSSAKTIGKDLSFPNSAHGFSTFFSEVEERFRHASAQSIAVILEPTGPYWKPIGYAIINKGWSLYIVSPEQVYHQRCADDKPAASKLGPKTIAKLLRDGKASLARLPQGNFRELQKLHREYIDLTKKLAREKIQLKSILAKINPEFTSGKPKMVAVSELQENPFLSSIMCPIISPISLSCLPLRIRSVGLSLQTGR